MLVAIPCFYYIEVADLAEGSYEAELLRVAWDGEAPIPDPTRIKPDMEGRIFSMQNFKPTATTPVYKVILDAERKPDDQSIIPDLALMAMTGQHDIEVQARNRYEAEQLAVIHFFSFYEGSEQLQVKITSVRMS
jgi:hypothetical protein